MNLVVTGTGKSGSWRIRGEQLGAAIGAKVEPRRTAFSGGDLVVYVKRMQPDVLQALRAARAKWVWDVVDAWPQPEGNSWGEEQAIAWLCGELGRLRPDGVVFPTEAMRQDSGWRGPSLVLPHHAWPKYCRPRDPDETQRVVLIVGYEGGSSYLGHWGHALRVECRNRGWEFQVNETMTQCDIGVALRAFDGWPARRWKSNVKLANIQALGVPALCSRESGYLETAMGAEVFVDGEDDLARGLDRCASRSTRDRARTVHPITLAKVAEDYRAWLTASNF